jgi:hypothetical protein
MERNRRTHPAAVRVLSRKRCDFPPDGARRLYYSGLDSKRQRIYTSGVEEAHSSLSSPSNFDTVQYVRSPHPNGISDTVHYVRSPHFYSREDIFDDHFEYSDTPRPQYHIDPALNGRQLLRSVAAADTIHGDAYIDPALNGRQLLRSVAAADTPRDAHDFLLPVRGHPGFFFDPKSVVSNIEAAAPIIGAVPSPPPTNVKLTQPVMVSRLPGLFSDPKSVVSNVKAASPKPRVPAPPAPPVIVSTVDEVEEDDVDIEDEDGVPSTVDEVEEDDFDIEDEDGVPPAWNDGLETQGFIYEEPNEAYWRDKSRLDDLGPCSKERWDAMRCIHFILPNMTSNGQATTPRQASVPHYQTTQDEIELQIESFRAAGGKIKFKTYLPTKDYSNNFLHVRNLGVPQIDKIDWEKLARETYKEEREDKKRQHRFKDYGTTGGRCTTRVGSKIGVASPAKKPGSTNGCIVDAMLALCDFTKQAQFKWLPKGIRPFNCDDEHDPRNVFGRRFHKDCFIPACRVGLTNLKHPCKFHCDEMNSTMLQYELVPTLSKIVVIDGTRYRCAVIGYSRRSIDEYLVRVDIHGTYVDFICDEYNLFDDERKHLSPALFDVGQPIVDCVPQFNVLKTPCNLDPWGHYSSLIESTLLLDQKYKLSLPERISLLRAMAVAPNSAYLYAAAAASLLQRRQLDKKHRKGYRFGLLLANVMKDIHLSLERQNKMLPPRRFNCYATYSIPGEAEWNKQCDKMLVLHLTTPDTKLKTERRAAYMEVRRELTSILPYVDVLGGNHLVAIAGTIGLLPLWVTTEIEIHHSRSMKWLLTKFFADAKERSRIKVDDVIANLTAALKTRYGGHFSRRMVENIVCKVFRKHTRNQSDTRFHDIWLPEQNLYSVYENLIVVMSANGKKTLKSKASLLPMVPFEGSYISLAELHEKIPDDWADWDPQLKGLGRTFLDGLFEAQRGEYPELSFDLNKKNQRNHWLSDTFVATEKRMLS